jgi:P27 family predicted phage terminase small subunit
MSDLKGNVGHKSKEQLEKPQVQLDIITDTIKPPSWLNSEAKREWKRILPLLIESGLLTHIDTSTLELYCQAFGNWKECEKLISKEGYTVEYTNKAGATNKSTHPAVLNGQKYAVLSKQYIEQLGLSPKSRSKLTVNTGKKDDDDLIAFIKAK